METDFHFSFGSYVSRVLILDKLPGILDLLNGYPGPLLDTPALFVCDENTESMARAIAGKDNAGRNITIVTLPPGENAKTLESLAVILKAAKKAGLGRDGLFVGVGGGVISDLTGFAASVFMRGARLCIVSTTLLGMVDAGIGGKTGIDFADIKNLAGTFYPAGLVVLPLESLDTLPEREWISGIAELIKTGILASESLLSAVDDLNRLGEGGRSDAQYRACLKECISLALAFKGHIVEADPREIGAFRLDPSNQKFAGSKLPSGSGRALLNLGHTFAHALESAAGLGTLSHGEAVAWGIARACELGVALGVTPPERAARIGGILKRCGYETSSPHPLVNRPGIDEILYALMMGDKKNRAGSLNLIIPGQESAQMVTFAVENSNSTKGTPINDLMKGEQLLRAILKGEYLP